MKGRHNELMLSVLCSQYKYGFYVSLLKIWQIQFCKIHDVFAEKFVHMIEQSPERSRPSSLGGNSVNFRPFNLGLFLNGFSMSSLDRSWMILSGSKSDSSSFLISDSFCSSEVSVLMPSLFSSFTGDPGVEP